MCSRLPVLAMSLTGLFAQQFEVATIKRVDPELRSGRFITMEGPHRFIAKNYTLKLLIAAAYELNPKTISGGPAWTDSDQFEIAAVTPGEQQPTRKDQMAMLRSLLAERLKLTFHREPKEFAIYALELAKNGPKLHETTAAPNDPTSVIATVFPNRLVMPARNATMADFAAVMQRAILDRPVVDRTGLLARYDFDLEWAADSSQFGGGVPSPEDPSAAPLFTAIQEQLGLKLEATRGIVQTLVIDKVERPSPN